MMTAPGRIRSSIQIASASKPTPNTALTAPIQGPALGTSLPADVPNNTRGVPMPRDMLNRAVPPRVGLPELPITIRAAASGGATQGPTIRADRNPMTATPPNLPPCWRPLCSVIRVCQLLGNCNS